MCIVDYRPFGRTGVKVSPLTLGAMNFGAWGNPDHDDGIRIIHRALDAGINVIDTADVYSHGESEEIVGKALAGGRRDEVVLATKFHGRVGDDPNQRGNSRRWIIRAVEDSLRRLQTDWIDLYQVHRPEPGHRHRRDARRADRPGPPGQDPLHRHLDVPAVADRGGAVGRRAARPRAAGHRAAAVLDPGPRHRARGAAGGPAVRPRRAPVEPARRRLAVRPLPPRRRAPVSSRADGSPARYDPALAGERRASSRPWTRSPDSPTRPGCR